MECTDLMLDDWVLDTYTGKPMRVSCVNTKVGKGLEPIPITSEILEKNGFVTHWKAKQLVCGTKHISYGFYPECLSISDWADDGDCQISSLKCKYVHELQHALRLCGIDKEIVL